MLHEDARELINVTDTEPIKVTPFAEAFREDLYNLYQVFNIDQNETDYFADN